MRESSSRPQRDSSGMPADPPGDYWSLESTALLAALATRADGLSAAEAAARLDAIGPNAIVEQREAGVMRLLARQFASPLVLILVVGAIVSAVLREWIDATIILAIVVGSSLLGFSQEYRASAAVVRLRARLALLVRARRDGVLTTLPATTLVPGDVIELAAGNLVPADGVILVARDFLVSEASLTGESFPVEKRPGVVPAAIPLPGRTNCAFLGTSVRSGTATMLVVRTGRKTVLSDVATSLRAPPPEPEFARGIRRFGYLLMRVMVLVVIAVLVANELLGRPVVDSLLFAVALAVGLSPELLPAIVSVTLARGAHGMAQRGVLVRRLDAIQDLGGMTVLCTDKTGTLTEGVMQLNAACDMAGAESSRVLRLAHLNATLESGIDNPLDAAIVAAGSAAGLDASAASKIDEIPYDFVRKRLTIVVAEDAERRTIITKGAFATVLDICTTVMRDGAPRALGASDRSTLEEFFRRQGEQGFRALALATKCVPARPAYGRDDESDMTFEGFLLFFDPPKPTAAQTIRDLAARGVGIKVVTGDNRYVAGHVAAAIGLDARAMLTGEAIAAMRDEALWHFAPQTDLFVEVDPQQKERIVWALQRGGHAVGYLGDGINDAPALHAADVGISVDGAVDVARESADVVLLRPDLDVLRRGVEDGRRTFANTLKYISITTSANFGNMVSMAVATPVLPFLPLLAKQILLNNFLSDIPSVAISTDNVDPEHTAVAQRWDVSQVRRFMVVFGLTSTAFDLVTFVLLLGVFSASEPLFQSAWFVVSLLTELGVVLVLRTRRSAFASSPSRLLLWATVAIAGLAFALPFVTPVARLFGFVPLPGSLVVASAAVVLAYLVATELIKRRFYRERSG
jgi:Mg2+-importing ATPase